MQKPIKFKRSPPLDINRQLRQEICNIAKDWLTEAREIEQSNNLRAQVIQELACDLLTKFQMAEIIHETYKLKC